MGEGRGEGAREKISTEHFKYSQRWIEWEI
jgi:hypothetical protein